MKKQQIQTKTKQELSQQEDESFNDPAKYDRIQESFENSMKLSVKDHIEKIEQELRQQNKYLETSKKDTQNVKLDFETMKDRFQIGLQDQLQTRFLNETHRVEKEYKRIGKTSDDELNFLIQNFIMLQSDQSELKKLVDHLEQRVRKVEDDVGFKFIFDGMDEKLQLQQQQQQQQGNDDYN